jgi:hypothetical protein
MRFLIENNLNISEIREDSRLRGEDLEQQQAGTKASVP